jgi:transcriptional regulatory protein RtcR
LARKIYELKKLRHQIGGAFVEVNCATLKGDSAMSALFGHRRGAFTGAIQDRPGLLKTADKGVLFLDEIGELGLDEQAMILRAIEDGLFLPVGADKEAASAFQLIAGTNRDLVDEVAAGRFREDLFARLNLWTFSLPGLADRREDIAPNLDYELERFAEREGMRVTFNKEARDHYLRFAEDRASRWRGNFRDLAASVTRMATLSSTGRIDVDIVALEASRLRSLWSSDKKAGDGLEHLLSPDQRSQIDPFDRVQLAYVVGVCCDCGSLSAAGRQLFSASREQRRSTNDADRLRKYLARFELDWNSVTGKM